MSAVDEKLKALETQLEELQKSTTSRIDKLETSVKRLQTGHCSCGKMIVHAQVVYEAPAARLPDGTLSTVKHSVARCG